MASSVRLFALSAPWLPSSIRGLASSAARRFASSRVFVGLSVGFVSSSVGFVAPLLGLVGSPLGFVGSLVRQLASSVRLLPSSIRRLASSVRRLASVGFVHSLIGFVGWSACPYVGLVKASSVGCRFVGLALSACRFVGSNLSLVRFICSPIWFVGSPLSLSLSPHRLHFRLGFFNFQHGERRRAAKGEQRGKSQRETKDNNRHLKLSIELRQANKAHKTKKTRKKQQRGLEVISQQVKQKSEQWTVWQEHKAEQYVNAVPCVSSLGGFCFLFVVLAGAPFLPLGLRLGFWSLALAVPCCPVLVSCGLLGSCFGFLSAPACRATPRSSLLGPVLVVGVFSACPAGQRSVAALKVVRFASRIVLRSLCLALLRNRAYLLVQLLVYWHSADSSNSYCSG